MSSKSIRPAFVRQTPRQMGTFDLDWINSQNGPAAAQMATTVFQTLPSMIDSRTAFTALTNLQGAISEKGVGGFSIKEETMSRSVYKWGMHDRMEIPSFVVDSTEVPEAVRPGQKFWVTLNENYIQVDGLFRARDRETVFMVMAIGDNTGTDGGTRYQLDLVDNDSQTLVPIKHLFAEGSPLNYGGTAKGELSATGQWTRGGQMSEYFANTQTHRSQVQASGSALTTDTQWLWYAQPGPNGKPEARPLLPEIMARELLTGHFQKMGEIMFHGKSNYDPVAGVFLNQANSNQGAKTDRPTSDGWLRQMRYTRQQYYGVDPTVSTAVSDALKALKGAAATLKKSLGLPANTTFLLVTGDGGARLYNDAYLLENVNKNVQYHITPDVKASVAAGLDATALKIPEGWVYTVNIGSTTARGQQYDSIIYDGSSYPVKDFDAYLIPVFKEAYADGRANLRVIAKEFGGINRTLVTGNIGGMSGLHGTMASRVMEILNSDTAAMKKINDFSSVATPVDGESAHALSEWAQVVEDPDMTAYLPCLASPLYY